MTEKEQFLGVLEREFPTTIKVLKAFPAAKGELKPHAKCKSAKDLAWMFVFEQKGGEQALDGAMDFGKVPAPPGSLQEVISTYEKTHKGFVERIRQTPDADLNKTAMVLGYSPQFGERGRLRQEDIAGLQGKHLATAAIDRQSTGNHDAEQRTGFA